MSELEEHELIIVGAGAAGLWAAWVAALEGASVLLLERTPRTGTKVLASGGTRCNLTTTLDAADAGRLYGPAAERFLRPALAGVPCIEAPLEKIFPASQSARDVRDALEGAARSAGVEIRCDQRVTGIRALGPEGYQVQVEEAASLRAERLILAAGGKSFPSTGTTGDGYAWLAALDLTLVEPVPALVPLVSPATWVHGLTGIAVAEAEVRLIDAGGKELARRRRPLLFTHEGLSGPAAMDVSVHVARALTSQVAAPLEFTLSVDLCADSSRESLREELIAASSVGGSPRVAKALGSRFPRRLVETVCVQAGLKPNPRVRELGRAGRHGLIESLKGLRVPISGTAGFDKAEVTAGGLCLRELDPRSMQLNRHRGLYVIGELLDLDGPIGGFNFQSAFATAELAGRHAAHAGRG
jgi:predicted Rossmann fold flavoprotein